MSWFGQDSIVDDAYAGETVAEGVTLERRSLLRLSAATLVAALSAGSCASRARKRVELADDSARPAPGTAPVGTLEIGELISEMYPRARQLIDSGGSQEEAYLMGVGELLARLHTPSDPEMSAAMKRFSDGHDRSIGELGIWLMIFNFDAGKGFEHHDHRDYNGVILGIEGEARIRNFDVLGDEPVPPKGQTFEIQQTRDDLILPGRFSTLGSTRENVHDVVAGPDGAKLLDVFTYLEPGARSYSMAVDPEPRDAARGIYEASWK